MRIALVSALALLVFACRHDETVDMSHQTPSQSTTTLSDPRSSTGDNTSTMNPVMPPQSDDPASAPAGASQVSQPVQLTEYSIRMPQTLRAGAQSFTISNAGKEVHNFEIEGNGVNVKLPSDLQRGDSAPLNVNLKPGTYTVYCPVKDHKQKGMSTTITVQ